MPIIRQDIADQVAWSFLGRPYYWGGDDPIQGFDCSGFVIEILKSCGVLPKDGDWTAHGLYTKFQNNIVDQPHRGCLVFWGLDRKTHVEYMLDSRVSIGASGGGSRTTTEEEAIRHNAYIKVRPIFGRNPAVYVDPFR